MFVSHWLGQLCLRPALNLAISRNRQRRRLSSAALQVEQLESRICLSAVAWDGGGDGIHWSDPANWQADVLPTANDDVSINFGTNTIRHNSGNHSIKSLTTANPLDISGGTLAIATTFAINNTVTLKGGTIQGGTLNEVAGDLVLTPAGGTLDGVTLNGSLDLMTFRASATIQNGITLNGTATLGRDALLFFSGTQTLGGTATVEFEDQPGATNGLVASTDGMTLTIGEHITLRGGNTDFGGTTIGYNQFVAGGTNTSIVNNGTIIPDVAGGHIVIRPRGTGTFTNHGTIDLQGGTLDLNGYLTPATVGNLIRTSGVINLFGTLDLEGATLNLADVGGTWNVRGGTVQDGTINESSGALLLMTGNGGTLDGVTLNGPLDMTEFRASATVKNGFTLNGTATMGRDALLHFEGTQTLDGQAEFIFQNVPGATNGLVAKTDNMSLTIGEHITLRGGNSDEGGTTIGYNPYTSGGTNTSIINRGTMIADTVGGRFVIRPRGTGTFTNLGHIALEGGTLDLDADVTPSSLGNLTRTAGGIRLFRTLDLTGLTLNLADLGGPWTLRGGKIKGGVINESGDGQLLLSPAGGILDGVTLNGPLDMTTFRASATIQNGFTLNGTATLGADALLFFEGTQTLSGQAEYFFKDVPGATNGLVARVDDMTLTIGSSVTLRGGNSDFGATTIGYNQFTAGGFNTSIVNHGTIDASTSGGRILIKPRGTGTFSNAGSIFVRDNAILEITTSLTIPDPSSVSVSAAGTLRLGGNLMVAEDDPETLPGSIQFNGSGTAQSPQLFEVRSQDLGLSHSGFFDNFAINALSLSNSTYVKLVNQSDNASGAEPEVLYAKSIVIPTGTTLDLNGLSVYTTSLQQSGAIVNGTISEIAPIPTLTLGQTLTSTLGVGQTRYYQVNFSTGLEPEFLLKGLPANGIVEMYISREGLPSRTSFDWSSTQPFVNEQSVTLHPLSSAGTYFILLYAPSLASSPVNFQLKVSAPIFEVRSTTFGVAGNAGDYTLKALGANFDSAVTARLTKASGFQLAAKEYVSSDSELYATFDLRGVAPGTYNVVFTNKNGLTVTVANSLTIIAATEPAAIVPRIIAPSAIRRGREFSFTVEWTNTSLNDVIVPLLTVGSTVPFGLNHNDYSLGTQYTFLGTNTQGGPAGILRAGQSETLTFWSYSDTEPGEYTVFVDRVSKAPAAAFDWAEARRSIVALSWPIAEIDAVWDEVVRSVGYRWGDVLQLVSRDVSLIYRPAQGWSETLRKVLSLEFQRTAATMFTSVSGTIVGSKSVPQVAGLSLVLTNALTDEELQTTTHQDGSFYFARLPAGSYTVRIHDLNVAGSAMVELSEGQQKQLNIHAEIAPQLQLRVRDTEGRPIEQWTALVWRDDDFISVAGWDGASLTPFSGFDVNSLWDGDRLLLGAAGFARHWIDAKSLWTHDSTADAVMVAEARVSGAFVDAQGNSVKGGIVVASDVRSEIPFIAILPDDSNSFTLTNLPAGGATLAYYSTSGELLWKNELELTVGIAISLGQIVTSPSPSGIVASQAFAATEYEGNVTSASSTAPLDIQLALYIEARAYLRYVQYQTDNGYELDYSYDLYYDYFYSGSETVSTFNPDSALGNAVLDHYVTQGRFADLKQQVLDALATRPEWQQTFACDAEQTKTYTLSELGIDPRWYEVYSNQDHPDKEAWAYHVGVFNLITGGVSNGGSPPLTSLVPDYRRFDGNVEVKLEPGSSGAKVLFDFNYTIFDSVDFWPDGNRLNEIPYIGTITIPWIGMFGFTNPLAYMEEHSFAFDQFWSITVPYFDMTTIGVERECALPPVDDSVKIKRPVSIDPNDIVGPASVGPLNHIVSDELMPYTIRFENAASAGAPAATVVVTQQLDSDLDWTTFRLGDLGFGDTIVSVPANTAFFQTRVDLRETRGVYVDVTAGINVGTGEIRWELVSVDPITGLPPENPLVGFLPPNVAGPQGEGFLNYTIRAKSSVVTGDRIDAVAPIVFDVNAPILTPPIFHTIDRGSPSSQVLPLNTNSSPTFTVSWEGIDDVGGSGIATYDIFVSDNGGSYVLVLDDTASTSFEFTGTAGHAYAFYSVATDAVGHREAIPQVADTSTTVAVSVNHYPTVSGAAFELNENSPLGTSVGIVSASDPDGDALTFSIIHGNLSEAFAIDPTSGLISVSNPAAIDFESHPSFALSVRVQDSTGLTHAAIVTITLVDLGESVQLVLGGTAVIWTKKQPPVNILPEVTVGGAANLAGGDLSLFMFGVGSGKKSLDLIQIPTIGGLGTSAGLRYTNGLTSLNIQLGATATTEVIQSFLRGITFSTKGKGLKRLTRTLDVILSIGGQSSVVSQTISVRKKG